MNKIKFSLIVKIIIVLTAIQFTACSSYNGLIKKGDKYNASNEFKLAEVTYKKAIDKKKENPIAYTKISEFYLTKKSDFNLSKKYLNKAIILSEGSPNDSLILSRIKINYKQVSHIINSDYTEESVLNYQKALGHVEKIEQDKVILELKKNDFNTDNLKENLIFFIAKKSINDGDFETCIKYLNLLLLKSRKTEQLENNVLELVSNLFLKQEKYTEAIIFLDQLLYKTDNPEFWNKLEPIYLQFAEKALEAKKYLISEEYLRKIHSIKPSKYNELLSTILLSHSLALKEKYFNVQLVDKKINYSLAFVQLNKIITNKLKDENASRLLKNELLIDLSSELSKSNLLKEAYQTLLKVDKNLLTPEQLSSWQELLGKVGSKIAEKFYEEKKYKEALDFINRILYNIPEHNQSNKIKEKIRKLEAKYTFFQGKYLLDNRRYELAEYYISKAVLIDNDYSLKSKKALASLYKKTYLVDLSIESLQEYESVLKGSLTKEYLSKNDLYFELAELYAVKDEKSKAKSYLEKLYCTNEYKYLFKSTRKNKHFYNLKEDPFFLEWSNGKRRMKIEIISLTDIVDLDMGFGISDPFIQIALKNKYYVTNFYKETENVYFNNTYVISDFGLEETIEITAFDYDEHEFGRGKSEKMGGILKKPFCIPGKYYAYLENDGNTHAKIIYSVNRTSEAIGMASFNGSFGPHEYSTSIYGKSCLQIGFETVYKLFKIQLSFYPFLVATIIDALSEGTIEASIDGVKAASLKYLVTKHASEDFQVLFRQFKASQVILNAFNQMNKNDCW